MTNRKGQPVDPADRALQAAEECKTATRGAHEVMQGMLDAAADLRAAIADGQRFLTATATEVQEVAARVTWAQAQLGRLENHLTRLKTPQEDEDTPRRDLLRCPHCECMITDSESIDGDKGKPYVGAVSVCARCSEPSFFAASETMGELTLRKPTEVELTRLARSPNARRGAKKVARLREVPK